MDWVGQVIFDACYDLFWAIWTYFVELPGWLTDALLSALPADFRAEYVQPVIDILSVADHWLPITEALAIGNVYFTFWAASTTWKLLWKYTPLGYLGGA